MRRSGNTGCDNVRGWHNDRYEHSLAARGIKTRVGNVPIRRNSRYQAYLCPLCKMELEAEPAGSEDDPETHFWCETSDCSYDFTGTVL